MSARPCTPGDRLRGQGRHGATFVHCFRVISDGTPRGAKRYRATTADMLPCVCFRSEASCWVGQRAGARKSEAQHVAKPMAHEGWHCLPPSLFQLRATVTGCFSCEYRQNVSPTRQACWRTRLPNTSRMPRNPVLDSDCVALASRNQLAWRVTQHFPPVWDAMNLRRNLLGREAPSRVCRYLASWKWAAANTRTCELRL